MTRISRRTLLKSAGALSLAGFPFVARAQQARVRTVAGTGKPGFQTEALGGSIASISLIDNPYGIVPGPDGALYFCEVDSGRIRRLDVTNNRLSTIAGNGEKGYISEARRPLDTSFNAPHELRWDDEYNLYIVERDSHTVRRIGGRTGLVSTLAGNGEPGFDGDGKQAVISQLRQPHSIAFDSRGNLLICDIGNQRLRIVDRNTGIISTLSGTGDRGPTPNEGPLEGTPLEGPRSIDCDADGNAYLVLREGNAVYQLNLNSKRLRRIAGTGEQGYTGDGGPALEATFNGPKGIAWSRQDNSLYIVDTENHVVRRMDLGSGTIETVLGNGQRADGRDGDPLQCALNRPHGVCVHNNEVYVTDSENHRIRAITGLLDRRSA